MTADASPLQVEHIRLGSDEYLWRNGHLQNTRGRVVPLRAKSLKMFEVLLAQRGAVLSKEQLSELVWPNTAATDESIARCVSDIRKALRDKRHDIVETFPKLGYRLNVGISDAADPDQYQRGPLGGLPVLLGIFIVLVVATLAVALTRTQARVTQYTPYVSAPSPGNSIAIMPFFAQAEEDGFLATGLAEDLEIHLAEVSGIRVISSAQTAMIADALETPVERAQSLQTRYLVEGSVRQNDTQISLSLRLIDGADGATLWADRYEGSRSEILAFRDGLPDALVTAMAVELSTRDRQRLARTDTDDPKAFEDVLRARRALSLFTYEASLDAEKYLRRAIARDPTYARAHAELASAFVIRMENDWIVLSSADTAKAFYFGEKALELDPDLWFSHYILGRLHSVSETGDIATALNHLETAMALQPQNDDARIYYAIVLAMSGDLEEANRIFESVLATHPQPPFWYFLGRANALFHQQRNEEALVTISQCLSQLPNSPYCLRTQIAILARLGRIEDAEWAVEEYAILGHETTLDAIMKSAIERDDDMRSYLRASYGLAGIE
ncbi:winged helix-turn-helix domain-containing tetratricopeptide repeat protein [Sulfitobacter aestuariivivens]|uniref:Tetratricopeptide repeat protein n=1 Tax=Sulfitobacter aestuariivivens TaxID=2766981 RepID=A0A927D758_9RHOB|nr:tetratricopeptide repeat protein [Sulfitobacter aestuariivivens]MBD3666169.1 tetratricopeptide repeat protein [Sulfitobacter aestuariivivens]